jgi:outer membrane protein OmpA-like peptidoglycan-associated protein
MKMWSKGLVGATCMLGLAAVLAGGMGGCSNSKKQGDLAMQESTELRERNATLEQGQREKDARIAELETKLANCNTAPVGGTTWAPAQTPVGYPTSGGTQMPTDFSPNAQGEPTATIAGNLLFDSGKATIKTDARKQLDRIAKEITQTYRGAAIRVEGHTDNDPIKRSKWSSNEALSQARADAVKQYLSTKGISIGKMTSIGYGSTQPKNSKQSSRRVEIVVTQ